MSSRSAEAEAEVWFGYHSLPTGLPESLFQIQVLNSTFRNSGTVIYRNRRSSPTDASVSTGMMGVYALV